MSTGPELGALEALRLAHARAAPVEEVLDLADAAIEDARARGDVSALREIADELTAVAAEHGPAGRGLTIAAARAGAAIY